MYYAFNFEVFDIIYEIKSFSKFGPGKNLTFQKEISSQWCLVFQTV